MVMSKGSSMPARLRVSVVGVPAIFISSAHHQTVRRVQDEFGQNSRCIAPDWQSVRNIVRQDAQYLHDPVRIVARISNPIQSVLDLVVIDPWIEISDISYQDVLMLIGKFFGLFQEPCIAPVFEQAPISRVIKDSV